MSNANNTRRTFRRMFGYFTLGFLLALIYFVLFHADTLARPVLFHPWKYPTGNWSEHASRFEEVSFKNSKNETLVGWYFPREKPARRTILYCHGNGENVSFLYGIATTLQNRLDCNVLLFDYAGYGKSEGSPTAPGILDDGKAALDWLAERVGVSNDRIIVYGQSLGGSVAVDLAARYGTQALIVESSFTSLGDMGRRMFPFLPVNWLLRERLASVGKIGNYHGPVLISHGKSDSVIPYSQGERLFKAANEPKIFYTQKPGHDYHSAPWSENYILQLQRFLDGIEPVSFNDIP